MTRHSGRGSSRPLIQVQTAPVAHSRPQRRLMLQAREHAFPLYIVLVLVVAVACCPVASFAQTQVDDVHVKPRVEPPDPRIKETEITDPSLKTHTKPMKVDVDLVLVPVTITDPMNRLVTGLDKDNFTLFEGKDQQEIKHFSSEACVSGQGGQQDGGTEPG